VKKLTSFAFAVTFVFVILCYATPIEMITVKAGDVRIGDAVGDLGRMCRPVHTVNFTYDYQVCKYEVTFDEYDSFCIATGRWKPDDMDWGRGQRPVIHVTWWDAIAYCNWLSKKEGLRVAYREEGENASGSLLDRNGNVTTDITRVEGYRLLTEAEWEYAARGGQYSKGYKYSGSNNLDEVGWYNGNSSFQTHPVGNKKANEIGLYDMSGNVCEWCYDWSGNYSASPQTNPTGPLNGSNRVFRGGDWCYSGTKRYRVAYRDGNILTSCFDTLGFRLARTVL
jgi:formylglycine-generating enzyme required for sulfatase activity